MAQVTPLPGRGCGHYRLGRCLYAERLNPGLEPAFRCRLLAGWEAEYDDFLSRAEAFGLPDDAALDILRRRMGRREVGPGDCPDLLAEDESICLRLWGDVCLLRLPACRGVCDRFVSLRSVMP